MQQARVSSQVKAERDAAIEAIIEESRFAQVVNVDGEAAILIQGEVIQLRSARQALYVEAIVRALRRRGQEAGGALVQGAFDGRPLMEAPGCARLATADHLAAVEASLATAEEKIRGLCSAVVFGREAV